MDARAEIKEAAPIRYCRGTVYKMLGYATGPKYPEPQMLATVECKLTRSLTRKMLKSKPYMPLIHMEACKKSPELQTVRP